MSLVETDRVTKTFGDVTAVDRISMVVHPGEIVGLLGANGAGKTTLIRMILGLISASSGTILTLGQPAGRTDRSSIGYVPQGLGLYPELTVQENLDFVAAAFGVTSPPLESALAVLADRQVGSVPLGLRRRTAFAVARCHEPELLILDEPTSGVGPLGRAELWDMIHNAAESGAGVLVSTHYMDEAEECDRVLVMSNGQEVAAGEVSTIIGALQSVSVGGVDEAAIDRLRSAGMTVLADGPRWRVVNGDLETISSIIGTADVQYVPATFEEAFVKLSV